MANCCKRQAVIKFVNNGNWAKNIEYEKLSLIATDSNWNYLYAPNGNLIADLPNYVEIIKYFNKNNEIEGLRLELGHVPYREEVLKTASAYFLLKIDDTTFDKIIGYYDTRCANLLLTKISYNGVEYPANEAPIEIIKEE
ncbi:MAG TPA: hypothetical protein VLY87_05485 [Flavobacterium sp.]|nr:hypothetical protein [Flavobacterium sp.]